MDLVKENKDVFIWEVVGLRLLGTLMVWALIADRRAGRIIASVVEIAWTQPRED